jgi:hypothetical protein
MKNQREITKAYQLAPTITSQEIGKAVVASVFEVEKQANDRNFQFVTPRSKRTGWLERSFKFGTVIQKDRAEIGPTAKYAEFVHNGTKRNRRPNAFMPRIANEAQDEVNRHFRKAVTNVGNRLSKFSR